ncbi:MAG: D-cysteine desulfhydrase [Pirellulales bacterium]
MANNDPLRLERFGRVGLCYLPTPLEPLARLSEHLGGPKLLVKRDDCTGLALGGNKARKLEFLLADALEHRADTVITTGGPQSNHARQTAAAAARLGLQCELVLPRASRWTSPLYETSGNVLLDDLLGASVHIVGAAAGPATIQHVAEQVRARGGTPYVIPVGGSTAVGALGYVAATRELLEQADRQGLQIDTIVVTTGSCTTHAGILVALHALGRSEKVIGMSIYYPAQRAAQVVREKARETAELLGVPHAGLEDRVVVTDDYLGPGYGEPTDAMVDAVRLTARREGLLLDPVYTGRAMSGLLDLVRAGRFGDTDNVVFWHTGGTPALFAYADLFGKM